MYFHKPVIDSLLFSIALAVGLTPQLLPAIININLSRGAQAMAAQGVIVRRLEAIENFGSMDVLCTDKTGTITRGWCELDGALDAQGKPSEQVHKDRLPQLHFSKPAWPTRWMRPSWPKGGVDGGRHSQSG